VQILRTATRRSPHEIWFRARQEAANLFLLAKAPAPVVQRPAIPLKPLPPRDEIARALSASPHRDDIEHTAQDILEHRFPLLGNTVQTGPEIRWRRDPVHGHETGTGFFRRIPYLNFDIAGDHKFVWEMNRHQHLVLLAQALTVTGDDRWFKEIELQLESWWEQNPFQRGINWASALEVAFRSLSWIWIYHLAGDRMSPSFSQRFLTELYRHGCHLEWNLSVYFSANTHLLGEAVALHALGLLFPQFSRAGRWRRVGRDVVHAQMRTQVRPDGSHFEQSSYYHVYATDMFLFHHVLEPVPAPYLERLEAMADYLHTLVDEDGVLPLIGDDDGGRFFYPYGSRRRFGRATLASCAVLLNRPDFLLDSADLREQAVWWLGSAPLEREYEPQTPRLKARLFPDAGIAVAKSRTTHLVFDAGPFGSGSGGHSHADTMSISLRHLAEDVLTDAGTFTYISSPEWRRWFRGTGAHNTVRIDGRDQAVPVGPFRWSDPPQVRILEWDAGGRIAAECSYGGFTHRRTVLFTPAVMVITDQLDGPAGEHDFEQFWHAGVGVPVTREPGPGTAYRIGRYARFAAPPDSNISVEHGGSAGWTSTAFGSRQETDVIVVRGRARFPVSLKSVIALDGMDEDEHPRAGGLEIPDWARATLAL